MTTKVENTGPVGSIGNQKPSIFKSDISMKDQDNIIRPRPVGNEFLELINKQLDIIREKDERINYLTNLLLRQNSIDEVNATTLTSDDNERKEVGGTNRWPDVRKILERKFAKVPSPHSEFTGQNENKIDYSSAANKAQEELDDLS